MPHINEKIDFTVEVFIIHKNRVLLRKHDKYELWLSVGGHIELDEEPTQTAIREVKEEVGLDIELLSKKSKFNKGDNYTELLPTRFMNIHKIKNSHKHVSLVYFAKAKTDKLILSKSEKSKQTKWFSLKELNNSEYDIKPHIKEYAKKALKFAK